MRLKLALGSADFSFMEPELQRSLIYAGLKLGIGLLFVASVVGIRILTATPAGVESEVAELESAAAEWSEEAAVEATSADRVAASVPPASPSARRASPSPTAGPDRMVSCDLGGVTQFMRAADCGARGGRSKDLKPRS